tara:strand:- start:107 stop:1081 length:975 start_codon:yes stop_codon:yes gene_type:complete
MIKWGILGLGNMGNRFAEAIKETKNAKLSSVASLNNSRLDAFSNKFQIDKKNCLNDYEELIKSDDVDAIYISTLNNTHLDLVKKCANSKKNILCEKPLGLNYNQAAVAKKYIDDNNIKFYEAIAYYSHPQTELLKKLISENEIGEVEEIDSTFGFKTRVKPSSRLFNKELGGGAILDVGCYPISFLMLFENNKNNIKFKNKKITLATTHVDDYAEANLIISKNISANIKVSLKENFINNCVIKGTNGEITIPNPWIQGKKNFIEIKSKKKYYKKFINSDKSTYAYQIEKISKSFAGDTVNDEHLFDINKSLICSSLLDKWIDDR